MYYLIRYRFKNGTKHSCTIWPHNLKYKNQTLNDHIAEFLKDKHPVEEISIEIKNPKPETLKNL